MAMRTQARKRLWLTERIASITAKRVDREAGIVYGVKVLGFSSANGRRYLPEAVKAALGLYERASVRKNHPRKATDSRDVEDVFGWLEGCELREDGLYADLHVLNPKTELAESVFNAAERNPRAFGLSHNAQGDVEKDRSGTEIVREITEVRSVDLVADPATTGGLFEDKGGRRVAIKLKALLEAIHLTKPKRRLVNRLLEAGMMDADLDMPAEVEAPAEEAPAEDHMAALKSGFEGSIMAVVQACLSGSEDCKEGIKKIGELLKTHQKLAGEKSAPVEEEEEEDLEECDDEDKPMKESRERLKRREKAYDLLEEAGVKPDRQLVEALVGLGDETKMRAFIDREKGKQQPAKGNAPRSGAGGKGKALTEGEDLCESINLLRS